MVGRLHQWLAIAKGLWPKLTAHRATKSNRSLTATPANFGERWRTLANDYELLTPAVNFKMNAGEP